MIQEIKIMRGPNMWSDKHHKLIVIKLNNLQTNENLTNNLCHRIVNIFPPLHNVVKEIEKKSCDAPGQMTLAQLLAVTGLELQALTTPRLSYHNAHLLGEDSYYAVFEYHDEEHGIKAAEVASSILRSVINDESYDHLAEDLKRLKDICRYHSQGPSTAEIVNEAVSRNIPVKEVAGGRFISIGQGKYQKRIQASISDDTSLIAVNIAGDKNLTKEILAEAMLPVPKGIVVTREDELERAIERIGFPLVTKPLDGHQGKCITTHITKYSTLKQGFNVAKTYPRRVIVEQHITGDDYRFLVINYKLVAAAKRLPASVTGNGVSTIAELIDMVNKDPRRGKGHNSVLTRIEVDEATEKLLAYHRRTVDTVLPKGEIQVLKDTANLSTGGTAIDVTDEVHPDNIAFAERAARIIGLDICGLDIMATDVSTPFTENGGAIIEVNAAPGLRMHFAPSVGLPRKPGKAIIDMMFPNNSTGRVPIVAITGTNGKTTTSRLMGHVVQKQGFVTGLTATEGIYINGKQIVSGDCSGPKSSGVILQDPSVEFAVLECARGGILRSGLAFDQCDVGIVTNVAADHLGLKDIYTVEDMARVKEVVPKSVKKTGYAILNAGDKLVFDMRSRLGCNVALFSLDEKNEHIQEHCKKGGIAAYKNSDGYIIIKDGTKEISIEHVSNIPITLGGRATFNIENVLPVVLSAYVLKFNMEKVKQALTAFEATAENAPGRLNIIEINNRHVIVDYAHNPHSFQAFAQLMNNIKEHKTGIITGVGDRRDEDIINLGSIAAKMYDEIIIRIDKDTRGRKPGDIVKLLEEGIKKGNDKIPHRVIADIQDALRYSLNNSKEGSYIVLNAEKVDKTLAMVKQLKEEYHSVSK
jgi:cyanophycin synthetase